MSPQCWKPSFVVFIPYMKSYRSRKHAPTQHGKSTGMINDIVEPSPGSEFVVNTTTPIGDGDSVMPRLTRTSPAQPSVS